MANGDKTYIGPISVNGSSPDEFGNIEAIGEVTPHTMGFHTDYPSEISIAELSQVEGLESNLQGQINSKFELGVGGGVVQISASSIVLVNTSKKMQEISITSPNQAVILPDSTTMHRGGPLFVIKNCGVFSFFVLNAGFMQVGEMVQPGKSVFLYLVENSNYKGSWFLTSNDFEELSSLLPMGLIVPFNSTSIPSGWSRFTLADNRLIMGAGGTTLPGANNVHPGGYVFTGGPTSTSGAHSGDTVQVLEGGVYRGNGVESLGVHEHYNFNVTMDNIGSNKKLLIKSSQIQKYFPQNSFILSKETLSNFGLTNTGVSNRCLMSANSIGIENPLCNISTSTNGAHSHNSILSTGAGAGSEGPIYVSWGESLGEHSHYTSSSNLTENYKRFLLSAWHKSGLEFKLFPKMIAMWESLTPPHGWVLCNGLNNTPNLQDCFIEITTSGNEGSVSIGNNTISFDSMNVGGDFPHNHIVTDWSLYNPTYKSTMHSLTSWIHSHNTGGGTFNYLPPYYALSFIMKK